MIDITEERLRQHKEHSAWMKALDFYENEIEFFRTELDAVVRKHDSNFSIVEHVDEYKAIFKRKLEHISELRNAFADHERKLSKNQLDQEDLAYHRVMESKYADFVALFEELKRRFKRFASRND